jgi:NitT/TauT family transport system permease protein
MKNTMKALRILAFLLILVCIWQFLFMLHLWPEFLFPSPNQVAKSLYYGFTESDYLHAIAMSLKRLFIGYTISIVAGMLLGILLATSELAEETLGLLVLGLQALPSICWLPLSLLWFGLSDVAIIFVVVAGSLLSITTATQTAIKHIPIIWVHAGRNMGAKGLNLYLFVIIPAALPTILEGLRQGWSFAWRSLMGGELMFMTIGLGHLMNMGRELNDMSQVIATMILVTMIGLASDILLFSAAERQLARAWGFKRK